MAAMGGAYFHYMTYSKILKNLLLQNGSMDFIIIRKECSFGESIRDFLKKFDPAKNMAAVGGACFHYMKYSKIEKIFFLSKMAIWNSL